MRNIIKHNDDFNERTNTVLYMNISLIIFSQKGLCWLCVRGELKTGQTATYWPKVNLTIAALISHPGSAAQSLVTECPSPLSAAGSHSADILYPTDSSRLCPGYIFVWCPPASAYLHRCISWLTARSRVSIKHVIIRV